MKKINKIFLMLTLVLLSSLVFPIRVSADSLEEDRTILGSSYTLESGRILNGNLNVLGGVVEIQEGATVQGNVLVLGGLVNINGTIEGDLNAVGGTINLEENAIIQGDVNSPASYINQDPGAIIEGRQTDSWNNPWANMDFPKFFQPAPFRTPQVRLIPIITRIGRGTAFGLVMVALGALLLLVMPRSADVMGEALMAEPWQILGFGALTTLVMLVGGFLLAITICLIPVVILIGLVFCLAVLVGWLTLGYELGKKMASSIFKADWHPVLSAVIGNLVLYLLARGLELIPCLGSFLVFLAIVFSLGMAVVTLFGTNPYPRTSTVEDLEPIVLNDGSTPEGANHTLRATPVQKQPSQEDSSGDIPVEMLNLSSRTTNALKQSGLVTVMDVLEKLSDGDQTMLEINGIGQKSLQYLKTALIQMGYDIPG